MSVQSKVDFWIGKRVCSKAVGSKKKFNGTVLSRHPGTIFAFIVRDDRDGSEWHREPSELTIIELVKAVA